MLRRRRVWIWAGVAVAIFGVGMNFVPLFDVLGFELALAAAVFASVCGLDLGAALARELQWHDTPSLARAHYPGRALAGTAVLAAGLSIGVALIPAAIAIVRGLL